MGSLVGGLVGGIGSLIGGKMQSDAANKAASQSLTGYNYLTSGGGAPYINSSVLGGTTSSLATQQLLGLLPSGPVDPTTGKSVAAGTPGAVDSDTAFNNYLNSTGYKFQLGQGIDAINSDAAAKGLLDSGGTMKALTKYGQGMGANYFNNYLNQLSGLNQAGYNATTAASNAGTGAGANAAQYVAAGGNALANGVGGAIGSVGGALGGLMSGNGGFSITGKANSGTNTL